MSNNNLPMVIKENKFDKLIKNLFRIIFKEEYEMVYKIDVLFTPKKINTTNIIIPREMKRGKNEKH